MPDQSPTRDALSRSPRPLSRRTGHSSRAWDTRVDTMELRLSKVRGGSYFPSPLKPRRRSTTASLVIIHSQQTTWQPFSPLGCSPGPSSSRNRLPRLNFKALLMSAASPIVRAIRSSPGLNVSPVWRHCTGSRRGGFKGLGALLRLHHQSGRVLVCYSKQRLVVGRAGVAFLSLKSLT